MATETLAVQLSGIEKRFPGVIANHDVNLNVRAGTIHAIVGENGAGKSTLMKTLYGMHHPEAGTITVNGVVQAFRSPSDAIAAGIGMVHQHFMLADNFTVLENIILGAEDGPRLEPARDHRLPADVSLGARDALQVVQRGFAVVRDLEHVGRATGCLAQPQHVELDADLRQQLLSPRAPRREPDRRHRQSRW